MHVVECSVFLYFSHLFLHWQMYFASSRSDCMNGTVYFVFPSLLLSLQTAFASPRSHYRMNITVCFVFPSPFLCLQMAFASCDPIHFRLHEFQHLLLCVIGR